MVSLKKSRGSRARRQLVDCEFIVWQSLTVSGPILFLPLVLALVAVCCLQHCNTATGQRSMAAIFAAVKAFDVEALRRELAAGVDPDILQDGPHSATPLSYAVLRGIRRKSTKAVLRRKFTKRLDERLECISVLLEAGASVDSGCGHAPDSDRYGTTPLYEAVEIESPAYHAVIAMLLEAGADPNFTDFAYDRSVLANAARSGTAAAVRTLISAGAVDLDGALEAAVLHSYQRNCLPLLRAGAALPSWDPEPAPYGGWRWEELVPNFPQTRAYIERIRAAGGFKAYEKAHRQRLTAIFLPKFPTTLPVEMLERVLEFTWDIGGH